MEKQFKETKEKHKGSFSWAIEALICIAIWEVSVILLDLAKSNKLQVTPYSSIYPITLVIGGALLGGIIVKFIHKKH